MRISQNILSSLLFLTFITLLGCSFKPSDSSNLGGGKELGEDAPIRFDGFYYKRGIMRPGQQQANGYTYLRFYADKTVVLTTSASDPEKIGKQFGRSHNQGDAKFKLYEDNGSPAIRFTIKHFGQSQSYEGSAGKESLKLKLYGGSSEFEYEDEYFFYEMDDMKE